MAAAIDRQAAKRFLRKVAHHYKTAAVILLNTLLLFALLNALLFVVFWVKDSYRGRDNQDLIALSRRRGLPTAAYLRYGDALLKVHPDLTKEDLELLLQETEAVPLEYEPFTQYKEGAHAGRWVNVDANGFRHVKGQGPWPPEPGNVSVFVFGGSTTFGLGVADGQTIPSFLQEHLARHARQPVKVYNFGRRGYYSSQERVLFERLLVRGHVPGIAVFIDGVNDLGFGWNDEPMLTKPFSEVLSGKGAEPRGSLLSDLPVTRAARAVKRRAGEAGPAAPGGGEAQGEKTDDERAAEIVERYWKNKRLIEAACRAHGVTPVFVWQPMPYYKYDLEYHVFTIDPAVAEKPPFILQGYSRVARELAGGSAHCSTNFLWLADAQEQAKGPLYVDPWHYTAKFSNELAAAISRFLVERNLLEAETR